MHLVGRVCSRLAEESRLIDRRVLVLSQMATASRSIPSVPGPSSVSVATQTVVRTYADASVEALTVRCMPRAEFLVKIRDTGGEGQYTQWVHCELIVGSETIRLVHTQRVNSGHI